MTDFGSVSGLPTLKVSREIAAPIDRVFAAWINAEVLSKWFGPAGFSVKSATIDARPGGKYSISLVAPDGATSHHFGEYLEVVLNERLCFTWVLSDQDCQGGRGFNEQTSVTVLFTDLGDRTQIDLVHERLPDQTSYDGHLEGWKGCLDSLEARFSV